MCSLKIFLVVVSMLASAAWADEWTPIRKEPDGMVLETRPAKDTAFPEVRVTAKSVHSALKLMQTVWDRRSDGVEGKLTERTETLFEEGGDRLLYVRLKPPMIGRRDYTIRYRALSDQGSGATRVWFRLENESGPPPMAEVVRMKVVRGEWTFTPQPSGGTTVVYQCVSDPAGDVAVWLAASEQQRIAVEMVREVLERAALPKTGNGV